MQYDESDLHFIQRLCEEEGIHYHFQHTSSGHKLTFGDDQTVFPKLKPVAYQQDSGMVASDPVIKRFDLRLETRTSRTTRRDYDFEKPRITLESENRGDALPDLEELAATYKTYADHGVRAAKLKGGLDQVASAGKKVGTQVKDFANRKKENVAEAIDAGKEAYRTSGTEG